MPTVNMHYHTNFLSQLAVIIQILPAKNLATTSMTVQKSSRIGTEQLVLTVSRFHHHFNLLYIEDVNILHQENPFIMT